MLKLKYLITRYKMTENFNQDDDRGSDERAAASFLAQNVKHLNYVGLEKIVKYISILGFNLL